PGLKTRWAAQVDPSEPLPEYPRPQMVRPDWVNLNGSWDLAILPRDDPEPTSYAEDILVPFPVESSLSGVGRKVEPEERIWYRRAFPHPEPASGADPASGAEPASGPHLAGTRWLLHFGAVDWEAEVFLNGVRVGGHRGGYSPFSFDVTDHLIPGRDQELVVSVWDPTDRGDQPRGKQVLEPRGIWYTAVSGIWQTVWLEPVPEVHIRSLKVTPRLDLGVVEVFVETAGSPTLSRVDVSVWVDGDDLATTRGLSERPLVVSLPEVRTWSPDDPFLYDLQVEIPGVDTVRSYFGMRSVALGVDERGYQRLLLNGEPMFQYGTLDQGWWPDGLYTAPTDQALRFDVQKTKELGFNLIRKHVKVEPARWYFHCDREGILVWQDMPSGDNEGAEAQGQFRLELAEAVEALQNHPAIVMWVPFNEGWGQHATEQIVEWLEEHDPTRLVNNASGWTDRGVGDVLDVHRYPGPGAPAPGSPGTETGRAIVLGEFGGLGLPLSGHTWVDQDNWGYRSFETVEALNQAYEELLIQLRPLIGEGLAAAVYTQTTDVEIEVNGIMTYDRERVKLGEDTRQLHEALFRPPPLLRPVVATSREAGQPWRFTTRDPGEGWQEPDFDTQGWKAGLAGFGTEGTPEASVRTRWNTPELWIRRVFTLPEGAGGAMADLPLFLRIHHDEDAEVYLNGTQIASLPGYTTGYRLVPMEEQARSLLRDGENTLAVHVRQTSGGQYIDVGIVEMIEPGGG
ncbi:MAG: hypothetical protein HKO65_19915, partial [Gemmatimonadetes bacterium]|nr:hypothetical protein [Gemmatimonadota bacterium]